MVGEATSGVSMVLAYRLTLKEKSLKRKQKQKPLRNFEGDKLVHRSKFLFEVGGDANPLFET